MRTYQRSTERFARKCTSEACDTPCVWTAGRTVHTKCGPLLAVRLLLPVLPSPGCSQGLSPTLPGLLRSRAVHARALLLQSNPACPAGCAEQGCVPESTSGGLRCALCLGSLLVDADTGTCACPRGKYGTTDSCASCPKGSYCEGGPYTGPGTPVPIACGAGLTTLGLRATSKRLCGECCCSTQHSTAGSACPAAQLPRTLRMLHATHTCA